MYLPICFPYYIVRSQRASLVILYSDLLPQCLTLYTWHRNLLNENLINENLKVNEIVYEGLGKGKENLRVEVLSKVKPQCDI